MTDIDTMPGLKEEPEAEQEVPSSPDSEYRESLDGQESSSDSERELTFEEHARREYDRVRGIKRDREGNVVSRIIREGEPVPDSIMRGELPPEAYGQEEAYRARAEGTVAADTSVPEAEATDEGSSSEAEERATKKPKRMVVIKKKKSGTGKAAGKKPQWPKLAWWADPKAISQQEPAYFRLWNAMIRAENDAKRIAYRENYELTQFWAMCNHVRDNLAHPRLHQKPYRAIKDLEEAIVAYVKTSNRLDKVESRLPDVYGPSGRTQMHRTMERFADELKEDPWIEEIEEEEEEEAEESDE